MKSIEKYKKLPLALKAGLWFTICNFLQKGISFITIPIFTRIMSTEQYGIYNVYSSWYSIITIFATLNLSYFVFNKGMVKYENDRNTFHISLQSLSGVLTIAIFILYLCFNNIINRLIDITFPMMLCLFAQVLFEPPILYWTARSRFEYRYKVVVLVTLAISLLNPLLGIIFVKHADLGFSALVRALSVSIVTAVFGLVLFYTSSRNAHSCFSTKYWKYALAFNLPLIPHFLSQTILNQSDRIMIKYFCGASNAAIYGVAYSVGMAFMILSQAIQQTYLPWLYQKIKKQSYEKIPNTASTFLALMAILNVIVIAFTPEIIKIVGTEEYLPAIWVMPSICGSVYFIFLQNLFANIEYYFEKTKLIAAASVGVAVANVALNYIFIPIYGFAAAGYTTLFCYVLHAIVHLLVMRVVCKSNNLPLEYIFNMKTVCVISTLFLISIFIMILLYNNTLFRYSVIIALAFVLVLRRKKLLSLFTGLRKSA